MDKKVKKAIITLSKVFPATHNRNGEPTGFRDKLGNGTKIHTIRANYEWWAKKMQAINNGRMFLSIREWSGKPYYSPQIEIRQIHKIGLQKVKMIYAINDVEPKVWIDGKLIPVQEVCKNDGLSLLDFIDWFFGAGNHDYEGACIQFTDFRYGG
jgi:hypothetical protein